MSDILKEDTIKCSDCNTPLMHYKRYGQDQFITKIKCTCPFCKGESFITSIIGKFAFGPIGQEEKFKATTIIDIQKKENQWLFILNAR